MERNEAQNILNNGFVHTIKDPLWQNIPMTAELKALTEVRDVQKLARIKQNGPVYHIYPGAVHSRLSHSIGVYYLGRQILLS
ncbi:MAG: phosphohydrolase, partial [Spirochaetales bacterium]|nr:phosphohydrolase [Candidatus Physcosoma equi]